MKKIKIIDENGIERIYEMGLGTSGLRIESITFTHCVYGINACITYKDFCKHGDYDYFLNNVKYEVLD